MKYNYKDHNEIDSLMVDYLLGMCYELKDIKEMPIEEINEFLNEVEDWYACTRTEVRGALPVQDGCRACQ